MNQARQLARAVKELAGTILVGEEAAPILAKADAVLAATTGACPKHPHVKLRCPACAGAKGGRASTPRKRRAARRNAKRGGRPPVHDESR